MIVQNLLNFSVEAYIGYNIFKEYMPFCVDIKGDVFAITGNNKHLIPCVFQLSHLGMFFS